MPPTPPARFLFQTADLEFKNLAITHHEKITRTIDLPTEYEVLPPIISLIFEQTLLTKRTAVRILLELGRIGEFLKNPQVFAKNTLEIIAKHRHAMAIDGIKYVKEAGQSFYAQEVFEAKELLANLEKNAVPVAHSVYDHVVYDSDTEQKFARTLDEGPDVKLFLKFPRYFKIGTPIGNNNPDWGVYVKQDGEEKLYFVLETKGNTDSMQQRTTEQIKIACGKQHFHALKSGDNLKVATSWHECKKAISHQ